MIGALSGPIVENSLILNDNFTFSGGNIDQLMFTDATGRTPVSASITEPTLVLACFGQSMAINQLPTAITPANAKAHALNPYNSVIYRAKDPEIGTWKLDDTDGGNYLTRLIDNLITNGTFPRGILMPLSIGSSEVGDWATRGTLNQRVRIAALQIMSRGWHVNPLVSVAAIWDQGHDDNFTSTDDYVARFLTVQNTMIGLGLDIPWFICCNSYSDGTTVPAVTAAGVALVNPAANRFQGANTDSVTSRQADLVHLDDDGGEENADLWTDILTAHYD